MKCQTPRKSASGFAYAPTGQHPARRSERPTGVCRVYVLAENVVCEEGESAGSPGYGGPRVWVLTATPEEAAQGPATRRREIRDSEIASAKHIHAESTHAYYVGAKQPSYGRVEYRTATLKR